MWKARKRSAPRTDTDAATVLGLLLLATVPYLNSLTNNFVYDDRLQVLDNPYVHSFRYVGKIFGGTVWTWEGAQGVTNYYRPLMTLAYLVCYKLFGPIPFGFHLLNLVLHAGVVVLLFAVTERLFGDRLLSMVTAGLFALHPIHTESVAWIAGVTDLELSFFFLLTFLFYLRLDRQDDTRGVPWPSYILMLAAYILALLSKEQAMVLPALAAAYEHFYRPDRTATTLRTKLDRYGPLCLIAIAYLALRHFALGGLAPFSARPSLPLAAVLLSAVALVGGYLWKLVWPARLSAFYVFQESRHISDPRVLAGIVGLLVCLALFVWLWRRARPLSFALLWMGATIAPVLNARWMPSQVFAERYLYLPSAGFCWLVGWAVAKAWRAGSKDSAGSNSAPWHTFLQRAVPAALALVAILYGVRTIRRNRDWRSEEVLYRQTLEEQPDAQLIRTNLGVIYWDRHDEASAEREWIAALGPGQPNATTLNNLGLLREKQMRYDEAVSFYEQAIHLRPKFADPHKNLADTYAEMDRQDDADREYQTAVALAPLSTDARNAYGHFLLDQGRMLEAREQFARSVEADPNSEAEENLGDIYLSVGDFERARAAYGATVAMDPFDNHAYFGLATLDEHDGRIAEAIREYRTGLETDPMNATALAAVRHLAEQRDSHAPSLGTTNATAH